MTTYYSICGKPAKSKHAHGKINGIRSYAYALPGGILLECLNTNYY